jgi:predicted DNA-binding transcriptional regulator AlpA
MLIERFKAIAAYLSDKTGLSVSENAARKWAARSDDPLPVRRMLGRAVARRSDLDEWLERRKSAEGKRK